MNTQNILTEYPELNFQNLPDDILNDILSSFKSNNNDNITSSDIIINENYEMAIMNIPEMLPPNNMIHIYGKINKVPLKILVDTGASMNYIFKSKIIKAGLDNLVDKEKAMDIYGIHGNKKSYGDIWYTEIEMEINKNDNNNPLIGLNFCVLDDENTDINEDTNSFDAIFGLSFMKSYKTNIDFGTNTITLNNSVKINFN